jgi:hypothetical protein
LFPHGESSIGYQEKPFMFYLCWIQDKNVEDILLKKTHSFKIIKLPTDIPAAIFMLSMAYLAILKP